MFIRALLHFIMLQQQIWMFWDFTDLKSLKDGFKIASRYKSKNCAFALQSFKSNTLNKTKSLRSHQISAVQLCAS